MTHSSKLSRCWLVWLGKSILYMYVCPGCCTDFIMTLPVFNDNFEGCSFYLQIITTPIVGNFSLFCMWCWWYIYWMFSTIFKKKWNCNYFLPYNTTLLWLIVTLVNLFFYFMCRQHKLCLFSPNTSLILTVWLFWEILQK